MTRECPVRFCEGLWVKYRGLLSCSECGAEHDRDQNAARNTLLVGLRTRASVRGNELAQTMIPIEPDRKVIARYRVGMWYATA
jgi:transposase